MTLPCEFCNGERWLSGMRDLGRCVCVTPDNLVDVVAMYDDTEREVTKLHKDVEALETTIKEHEAKILELQEATDTKAVDAADFLRDYAVSIGLTGDPLARNQWPAHLWEALECLTDF